MLTVSSTLSSPVTVPSASRAAIWIDFDGTITRRDVLDDLIRIYAIDDSWKRAEDRWQRGLIGSRACLQEQFASVRINPDEIEPFVSRIPIDPGLPSLIDVAERAGVPVTVVSDGVDIFIAHLLRSVGLSRLTVRSNGIAFEGQRLRLKCLHFRAHCRSASAHCKCASIDELAGERTGSIYIGDGRSDLCPAQRCEAVFAKAALARSLNELGKPFVQYETLIEVANRLSAVWEPA